MLALSTMKPQENWTVLVVLGVWVLADWRARRALAASFVAAMLVLEIGSEWLMPGWLFQFVPALARYNQMAVDGQIFPHFLPWGLLAALTVGWLALLAWATWRARRDAPDSPRFAVTLVFALAIAQVTLVMHLTYESIYLIPALLSDLVARRSARSRRSVWSRDWSWRPRSGRGRWSPCSARRRRWGWGIRNGSTVLQFLPWQIDTSSCRPCVPGRSSLPCASRRPAPPT